MSRSFGSFYPLTTHWPRLETYLNSLFFIIEGYRLEGDVIKSMNAHSGMDCIDICMRYDETCRSVNFRISENASEENCELLQTVDSEEPASSLKKNENFHYHILLQPKRVSAHCVVKSIIARFSKKYC